MKRLTLCLLAALLLAAMPLSAAQAKTFHVSVSQFVEHPALDAVLAGFQKALKDSGVEVEYSVHNAQAKISTANQIAQAIAGEKPDLVLAIATPSAQTCAQVMKKVPHMATTPLIFGAITDPQGAGLVKNIEKPGGYITGVSDKSPVGRHVDMIREFQPELKTLGVVYNAGETNSKTLVDMLRAACKERGLGLEEATVATSGDIYMAAKTLAGRVDAIYAPTDNTIISAIESLVRVCRQNQMPLYAADVSSVERGAVAALGFDYFQHGVQAGQMAKRILADGVLPADLPVEFQKELSLQINLSSAKAMGLDVPEAMLKKADKVLK